MKMKKIISLLLLCVFIVAVVSGCGTTTTRPRLTLEKYNKIENGMTYEEVVKIIGFEGTPEAEAGERGTQYHTISYRYMGSDQVDGSTGANASFMFQGGKLSMKAQLGLK
jgi:uncharacterized protein YceK